MDEDEIPEIEESDPEEVEPDIDDDVDDEENEDDDNGNNDKDYDDDDDDLLNDILKDSGDIESKYTDYKQNTVIDDDEYNDSSEFLQKFEKDVKTDYISENHPECLSVNYDEIKVLSNVTRDKNSIIVDKLHRTLPILTKYEQTRILGIRTKQLNNGALPYISVKEDIIDNYLIAQMELKQKKIPFIIGRPLPNNTFEYWNLQDLEIL